MNQYNYEYDSRVLCHNFVGKCESSQSDRDGVCTACKTLWKRSRDVEGRNVAMKTFDHFSLEKVLCATLQIRCRNVPDATNNLLFYFECDHRYTLISECHPTKMSTATILVAQPTLE